MKVKTFYIKTFGCQMNHADSEKINMILMSAGLRKVIDPVKADVIILNTCSVRQKGEDRVFGFMNEVTRFHKKRKQESGSSHQMGASIVSFSEGESLSEKESSPTIAKDEKIIVSTHCQVPTTNFPLFGITGCMVRKSGIARRYLVNEEGRMKNEEYKRQGARKIALLTDSNSLSNYDDELFLRSPLIDFTFRIEEVSYLTKILSLIMGEDIGNDAKFNEYLAVKQLQENPSSANIIIQTGCDNYCTYCIVPHTRGREVSRSQDEIVSEIEDVIKNGTKEVTLLGQNVNSYGKETRAKLWNRDEMKWVSGASFGKEVPRNEAEDFLDMPLRTGKEERVWYREDLREKAKELRKNMTGPEKHIWYDVLARNALKGFHFLRQKPLLDYIVDFYCDDLSLAIEIDGESHIGNEEYDKKRTEDLGKVGIVVVRFTNDEILKNIEGVYENLVAVIRERQEVLTRYHTGNELLGQKQSERTGNPQSATETGGQLLSKGAFKTPFRELLETINQIDGLDRIRFTSSNPHDMTRDILDAHFDLDKMCHYLHFALQSGSDSMLRRMNRKHTYADFKMQLDYLRSRDPLFAISTDIIVGFPGETEDEFQATVRAMQECQFDFAYIARYSPRSGTIADDRYEDDIAPAEKARRWNILNDLLRETVYARNLLMVGRKEEILISGAGKDDTLLGRTRNFKEVYIPFDPAVSVGDIVRVKITELDRWVLQGKIL